jgi:hypothetical protein
MVGDKLLSYSASRALGQSHFSRSIGSDKPSRAASDGRSVWKPHGRLVGGRAPLQPMTKRSKSQIEATAYHSPARGGLITTISQRLYRQA